MEVVLHQRLSIVEIGVYHWSREYMFVGKSLQLHSAKMFPSRPSERMGSIPQANNRCGSYKQGKRWSKRLILNGKFRNKHRWISNSFLPTESSKFVSVDADFPWWSVVRSSLTIGNVIDIFEAAIQKPSECLRGDWSQWYAVPQLKETI